MLADALRELRHHWSRVVATLLAIALSVGFMVAVSTFLAVESKSLGRQASVFARNADLVVTLNRLAEYPHPVAPVQSALSQVPGVAKVERLDQSTGVISHDDSHLVMELYVVPEEFRWSKAVEGRWPQTALELAIGRSSAKDLDVGIGSAVTVEGEPATVVAITDDPPSKLFPFGYRGAPVVPKSSLDAHGNWLVRLAPGADPQTTVTALRAAIEPLTETDEPYPDALPAYQVMTADHYRTDSIDQLTGQTPALKLILMAFAVVALLVGMIIIANTFKILLAQRRRQIGLLRAVGASGAQVRAKVLAEAFWVGLVGSALGVLLGVAAATIGSAVTGSLSWAWTLPWTDIMVEVVIGVLITVVAAVAPALSATRVAPLEALQPVLTVEQQKRVSRIRVSIGAVMAAIGFGLAVGSFGAGDLSLPFALGAGFTITFAVVILAPLFVPALLRVVGGIFGRLGPTVRLAATNAVRNPTRAAATATALMLAVGLIVTLQVGAESMRRTVSSEIDSSFPIDLEITRIPPSIQDPESTPELPENFLGIIDSLPNVGQKGILRAVPAELVKNEEDTPTVFAVAHDPELNTFLTDAPADFPDDTVWVSDWLADPNLREGSEITLRSATEELRLTVHISPVLDSALALVSQDTAARLSDAGPEVVGAWINLADRNKLADTASMVAAQQWEGEMMVSGNAFQAWSVEKVISILLAISTGLLTVAILISLVGVANTLSLSVIERSRESALLRALGLQRSQLRLMLLYEALLLSGVAVLVGLVAGSFFGWLGIQSLMVASGMDPGSGFTFAVNIPMTLLLIVIAVGAAAVASIGPGRRAANASPVEVLAEE